MPALIGKKVGMTQAFGQGDALVPITVVQAGPCPVLQIKSMASDGYSALRLCFGEVPPGRVNKPSTQDLREGGRQGTQDYSRVSSGGHVGIRRRGCPGRLQV